MKTRQTTRTITRLVEMKRRAAEAAEAAYAVAHNATADAEQARVDADKRWIASLEANDEMGTISDLEERDAMIRGLRRAVDAAEQRFYVAHTQEGFARQAMVEARVEHRRYEVWLEREAESQALEVRRIGRIAEDEVATRKRNTA